MQKINEGSFSKIYRTDNGIIAITANEDQSKFILATLDGKHIPKIIKLETLGDYTKFSMPEYGVLTGFNIEIVRYIIAAWSNFANTNPVDIKDIPAFYNRCVSFLDYIKGMIDHSLWEDMYTILDAMPATRINFDLHYDNFMQDGDGVIILLDIVWDISDHI